MKCPACVEAGQVSRFNLFKAAPAPAPVERFYDEAGALHIHDHATYKVVMVCTNGHSYMQESMALCPMRSCTWNEQNLVKAGEVPIGAPAGK